MYLKLICVIVGLVVLVFVIVCILEIINEMVYQVCLMECVWENGFIMLVVYWVGFGFGYVENVIFLIMCNVLLGVFYVEVDVVESVDGVLYLMYDWMLDCIMMGMGEI